MAKTPKMSRADYELIARTIRETFRGSAGHSSDVRDILIDNFIDELRRTNPGFKPERFRDACLRA